MSQATNTITELKDHFGNKMTISRKELYEFYQQREKEIHWSTLDTRIRRLKQKKILQNIGRGHYSLNPKPLFQPLITETMSEIYASLQNAYSLNHACIWHTSWLNEFNVHQNFQFFYLIEVDRDTAESVFYHFKDEGKAAFLQPDKKVIEYYVSETRDAIVVKPIVSRSPVQKTKAVVVPKLEKLLVDIFCDQHLHFAYQNTDLIAIYQRAARKYHLNYSTLISYARRREKAAVIGDFIVKHIDKRLEILVK